MRNEQPSEQSLQKALGAAISGVAFAVAAQLFVGFCVLVAVYIDAVKKMNFQPPMASIRAFLALFGLPLLEYGAPVIVYVALGCFMCGRYVRAAKMLMPVLFLQGIVYLAIAFSNDLTIYLAIGLFLLVLLPIVNVLLLVGRWARLMSELREKAITGFEVVLPDVLPIKSDRENRGSSPSFSAQPNPPPASP